MATRTVTLSAANAMPEGVAEGSFLWVLASIVNRNIQYRMLGNPSFEISTNFDVQNGDAFDYVNGGILKTLATDQAWDTGAAKDITIDRWASALLELTSAGATALTWSASDYASEALAIAALPAPTTTSTQCGYVTVLTASGVNWVAGTDALQGGTGGDPSDDTNYYNIPRDDVITTREMGAP